MTSKKLAVFRKISDMTFELKINKVTTLYDRCDSVVYNPQSLHDLLDLCEIPRDQDNPEEYDANKSWEFLLELEIQIDKLLKQWATYRELKTGPDIFIITEIKGEFNLHGHSIKVNFTGVQKGLLNNLQAREVLKREKAEERLVFGQNFGQYPTDDC